MGAGVQIVEEGSLRVNDAGYEVSLRLNWYRSLPLSCVERILFSLDGQAVESASVKLEVNGHIFSLAEMPELVEEYWFVQDAARLLVEQPGAIALGETHRIQVEYALRFPYIAIGPGRFLTNVSKYNGIQTVVA